ncbi:uncharacterized protein LOC132949981 [Metopolophium dirhodum]|uniref:uncharacterized protein LOC132949981 n=1 Tax=Metopolophium dirhodum TaxID=44670 RepID=UPI0029901708|nr:uncharacterized protein LOC132949981 [Metopolophium dirhodum]XP_060877120.1 uncharacterized protein LOC132949981 [Metopolophium dirhodum]XP_060877121.1 uncharacterized protein LOC132949981 [Metopolophium dirhodum]XP_060877123.1 uncharacterized protein LOC132949981 [Metopolophium dirhodum]
MIGLYTLIALLLWASIASHSASELDWVTVCNQQTCRCKWVSGQKMAECINSSLTGIPKTLSNEVQVLDLTNNKILEINKDAFREVGLINLHKLIARNCSIELVDKDAFRGLEILIELDLSNNNIHVLHPTTFRDPFRLRKIYLNHNHIQRLRNGLFSNMSFLQTVELNSCLITDIEPKTFYNITKFNSLELSGNQLANIKAEVLYSVPSLMNLGITNNPWRCDCKLRPFMNLVMNKNLYIKTASCTEPPRLLNKLWGDIKPDDFACQPIIQYPAQSSTFQLDDDELMTIGCKIYGEPMPSVQWVFNNRPISNYSHGDYKFTVYESVDNTMAKWINLTVSRSRLIGKSEFKCIAQNPAGLEERKITVIVQGSGSKGILGSTVSVKESLPIIIGLVAGIFIIILLLIVCCLCCYRRRPAGGGVLSKKSHANGFSNGDVPNHHNHVTSLVSEPSEQQKSLLAVVNPVQKPPRRYESSPTGTEMTELKRNLLDETSVSGDADEQFYGESGDELANIIDSSGISNGVGNGRSYRKGTHPPDLLAFPRGSGGGGGHSSPAGSVVSTVPSFQSPLHSPIYSGTLPYNRSQSPFSSRPAQPPAGYVTIPRRPRVPSWASSTGVGGTSASTPTPGHVDDPLGVSRLCEPVYDNLGPRTTADGSSVLSLTKAVADSAAVHRPKPQYSQTLPHKTKLHSGGGGHRPRFNADDAQDARRVPSPAPRSPDKTSPSQVSGLPQHNALPPNYSPLVEMDARNRSSWAPSRVGTPESGVLKPASQTSVKRKVPPKPPPKPKMKGGPLFEDEGEDGTEV